MSLIEVEGLNVHLMTSSGPVKVVSDLSFEIEKGTVFGFAGESGCGKSVTALAIMGILPPNLHASGEVNFKGRNLLKLPPSEMRDIRGREISMIFQEPMTSLNPVLRVGHQVKEAITTHLDMPKKEAERAVVELLRAVRIPDPERRARQYPHQMSGGMRQRVMMAMAIACGPSLLIADEPTTALDVTIEAQILDLIGKLREEKGMAVMLITHDLGIIAENAKKTAIMYAGRLVEVADVKSLFERPRHPYTMGLMGSLPAGRGKALKPIPGTVPRPGALPPGCKFSDRCRYAITRCGISEPELRDLNKGAGESHLVRCIRAEEIEPRADFIS